MPHEDWRGYWEAQKAHALSDPLNRHAGRVYFSCSDEGLKGHDCEAWLIGNFLLHKGAIWFARNFRGKFGCPPEPDGQEGNSVTS